MIADAVKSVAGNGRVVCDLFSGSGVVTQHLLRDYDVIASDIQEYARVLASAMSSPAPRTVRTTIERVVSSLAFHPVMVSPLVRNLVDYEHSALEAALLGDLDRFCDVLEHGSIFVSQVDPDSLPGQLGELLVAAADVDSGPDTVLTRYYGGVYFSYQQAAELDTISTIARSIKGKGRDVALAAAICTASEIVSTVGNQFAQPLRPRGSDGLPKTVAIRSVLARRQKPVVPTFLRWLHRLGTSEPTGHRCEAVRADFRDMLDLLPPTTAAVYADPPYTRDHYSRFYHVLETIALGDEPEVSVVTVHGKAAFSRGLYRKNRHQSPFCIKSEAPEAFEELFAAIEHRKLPLVLSYSPYDVGTHPRVLTIDQINAIASKFFSHLAFRPVGRLAHSKLNTEKLNFSRSFDAELILICRP